MAIRRASAPALRWEPSWSSQTVLSDEFLMTTCLARMTSPQVTRFEVHSSYVAG